MKIEFYGCLAGKRSSEISDIFQILHGCAESLSMYYSVYYIKTCPITYQKIALNQNA